VRSALLETSARLLALLGLMQSRAQWSGAELATRLGVGERTVRKDMERLRELGYPIDAARGPAGGYQLGDNGRLPPLSWPRHATVTSTACWRFLIPTSSSGPIGRPCKWVGRQKSEAGQPWLRLSRAELGRRD